MKNEQILEAVHIHTNTDSFIKKRIVNLDIARTFAIITVVLCHAIELIYTMNFAEWANLDIPLKLFRIIGFTIGRLGVPIFLLLTGYLLLNRQYKNDEDVEKFYKKKLLPIIIVTEIWILIYKLFIIIYNNGPFDKYSLISYLYATIKEMLFIQGTPMMNMWYMPMIIGIYIAIPYISKVIKTFSLKSLKIPMILVFTVVFVLPTTNLLLRTFQLDLYGYTLDMSFFWWRIWFICDYGIFY